MTTQYKLSLFIIAAVLASPACKGQSDSSDLRKRFIPDLKLSYLSTLIYPGFSAGTEFQVTIPGKSGREKSRLFSIDLNFYHHPGFHDNIYLKSELIFRRKRPTGFFSDWSAGGGFSRTILGGTTYNVGADGTVLKKKNAGYNYVLLTAGSGIGFDLYPSKKIPLIPFARMHIIAMFPFENVIYFRPVLELGVGFSVNHFLQSGNRIRVK